MSTTRRDFLAGAAVGGAGLLLGSASAHASSPLGRRPAGAAAPATSPSGLLDAGRIKRDEAIATAAIAAATKQGADYADVRLVSLRRESVSVRDDHVSGVGTSEDYGLGVRVLVQGAWGFAATDQLNATKVDAAVRSAIAQARASSTLNGMLKASSVILAPTPTVSGTWVAPFEVDPFTIGIDEKAEFLIALAKAALTQPGVGFVRAGSLCVREEKLFLSSEGTRTHQLYFRTMPSLTATAVDRRRGRFSSRDHEVAPMLAGWEYVRACLDADGARKVGEEAVQKLHAAPVEPGERTVILAPSNLWLTIHESVGHPTELDRAIGEEANYAGTSFLKLEDAGKLRFGSDLVTIAADRTQPGGLATTAWDDEGVASQRWPLIDRGTFVGWQTTREQAHRIGESASRGCSYGEGFSGVAFQRMPNVSLQPGTEGYTTEDLINATDDGILISGRGSWSIDHQRYNFQFSGQYFWEIKNGRLSRPLRDVAYQANTLDFWRSCDMIGGEGSYRLGGSFSDGKGEPSQSNAVSHGCPPARFRVNIVNTGDAT